ncbi:MAG: AAA family ATPase [Chloroflexota bacterium]|nr:AAA family ATPase [Chloroflexota bacterium]
MAIATELLTTTEAARRMGVNDETVRRYIKDGTLPALTTAGGHYRLRPADITAYLTGQGLTAASGPVAIAVVHHAGGVGKTTTALNLGHSLARAGRRVLLVDLDPQADLSERLDQVPGTPSLAAVLLGKVTGPPAVVTCRWPNTDTTLDLIPGALEEMADVEMLLGAVQMREQRLARALAPLQKLYDVILFDCPPSLSLLTTNAFWAADQALVPLQAQDKALRQLPKILNSISQVQQFRDGPPALLGVLLTMTAPNRMSREVEQGLREAYGDQVFDVTIPQRTRMAEDARWAAPVALFAPKDGAEAYHALAQEVIQRARA